METINHNGNTYPAFQASGNAARFIIPFAMEVCKGVGYDIGCSKIEWMLKGALPIEKDFGQADVTVHPDIIHSCVRPAINNNYQWFLHDNYEAHKLPSDKVDYIFSSHCLEHLPLAWNALDYWYDHLKDGGILFLYLPDHSQTYWRPYVNKKHFHAFTPEILKAYFVDKGFRNIFVSGIDLNNSFAIFGEK